MELTNLAIPSPSHLSTHRGKRFAIVYIEREDCNIIESASAWPCVEYRFCADTSAIPNDRKIDILIHLR